MASRSCIVAIFLCALATLSNGFDMRRKSLTDTPTAEECMRPPMKKHGRECCNLPKERIWGDLRSSMDLCFRKLKQEPVRQGDDSQMTPMMPDVVTPPSDSMPNDHRRRGKKPLSIGSTFEKVKCFMECVFEEQGFLADKILNKNALLERLNATLGGNEPWYKTAIGAVETCYQTELPVTSNKTCSSGAEEIFRCVFKQIFFNCPNWTQSDYCMSLKAFYQKCPNGPPPEINDNHSTSPMPTVVPAEQEDMESNPSTESETNTTPA